MLVWAGASLPDDHLKTQQAYWQQHEAASRGSRASSAAHTCGSQRSPVCWCGQVHAIQMHQMQAAYCIPILWVHTTCTHSRLQSLA